jgi:hypothetical protein
MLKRKCKNLTILILNWKTTKWETTLTDNLMRYYLNFRKHLHVKEIERYKRIALSSTYPSSYCILIGLEKPLSDSLWNANLDLVEMDDAETSSSSTRIGASAPPGGNQATSTYRPIINQSIKLLHIDWA